LNSSKPLVASPIADVCRQTRGLFSKPALRLVAVLMIDPTGKSLPALGGTNRMATAHKTAKFSDWRSSVECIAKRFARTVLAIVPPIPCCGEISVISYFRNARLKRRRIRRA
jgi:hypothetical protein